MTISVGIDAIAYYVPPLTLPIPELARARDIVPAKLERGLGLKNMALPDTDEDAASMAANALYRLLVENDLDPREIGRVYLGTESALDAAKPTATYAVGTVEEALSDSFGERSFQRCDVVDLTFACIAAVDAVQNCLDWIAAGTDRKAIVIASDIAKYELGSTGEYTQGAGAVALLLTAAPRILSIDPHWGVGMAHVGDFFKPRRRFSRGDLSQRTDQLQLRDLFDTEKEHIELFFEEPVFDGQYSNQCYKDRISEAMDHLNEQQPTNFLEDWQQIIFHLPYAYQGRRMILDNWLGWLQQQNRMAELEQEIGPVGEDRKAWKRAASKSALFKNFVAERIAPGEVASSEIGNMYTASIFMSLLSYLIVSREQGRKIAGDTVGFLAYGSGSKSKAFSGQVQAGWQERIAHLDLFGELSKRTVIDLDTYERLHNGALSESVAEKTQLRLAEIETAVNREGYRIYA